MCDVAHTFSCCVPHIQSWLRLVAVGCGSCRYRLARIHQNARVVPWLDGKFCVHPTVTSCWPHNAVWYATTCMAWRELCLSHNCATWPHIGSTLLYLSTSFSSRRKVRRVTPLDDPYQDHSNGCYVIGDDLELAGALVPGPPYCATRLSLESLFRRAAPIVLVDVASPSPLPRPIPGAAAV